MVGEILLVPTLKGFGVHTASLEEGSHIDGIFPQDGVEESKILHVHYLSGVSIIRKNGMVNLGQIVEHFL